MKRILIALLVIGASACSQQQERAPQNLATQIDALIEKDMYVDALNTLEGLETSDEVATLKEKVHLNYGLYLEYRDSNTTNMRDKMNGALAQYIEVLKLNPDNEKAISEIEQILGIYASFPDRSPEESIVQELQALGFEV
ncbi:MAG: hypothetical protein JJ971_03265 [Balneolaceae bacterium]|nr:hypothetical protein [Balneolaceae bacterium]MBO6545392.1 hypothetical protein [Balneolaceae bacterium]MBO6646788.1 hypothetical protein [Balneolaceae bacterium]